MPKKKTKDEYIEELKIKNPTVELVGDYINAKTKTLHHCVIHDIYWEVVPDKVLRGCRCKLCGIKEYSSKRRKSREQYTDELKIKNPTLTLIGDYINNRTPTEHYCNIHSISFDISPENALKGEGCKYCRKDKLAAFSIKSKEQYINELAIKNPDIQLVGEYFGTETPTKHRCLKHDFIWDARPANILYGMGCKYCKKETLRNKHLKPIDKYISELSEKNSNIKLVGEYISAKTPVEHYCEKHNVVFDISPMSALKGCGCPSCNNSNGEKGVKLWLDNKNISYTQQKKFNDCRDKKTMPFDFYLDDYNICIEYQGKQHYEPVDYFGGYEALQYTQYHDMLKREYCTKNNIELICIPYWEDINQYLDKNLLI